MNELDERPWGLVRGGANLLMYPALKRMGYGMDLKMLTMMTWGGLRGAVGLALALMVQLEDTIDERVRHLIVFHVGIVAALTILINGTFTPKVLDLLGMNKSDPHKEKFFDRALEDMQEYADKHCRHLRGDALMGNPDWEQVRELTMTIEKKGLREMLGISGLFGGKTNKVHAAVAEMIASSVLGGGRSKQSSLNKKPEKSEEEILREMVVEMRTRFYHTVKAVYAEGFENGYMDANVLVDLRNASDTGCDTAATSPISDWDDIENQIQRSFARQKILKELCESPVVRGFAPLLAQLLSFLHESVKGSALRVTCYLYAHQEAQMEVTQMVDDGDEDNLSMEEQAAEIVVTESERCCVLAETHATNMKNEFPDVFRTVKTFQVARTVLMHKQRAISHLKHRGLLEDKEVGRLERMTEDCVKRLMRSSGGWRLVSCTRLTHEL